MLSTFIPCAILYRKKSVLKCRHVNSVSMCTENSCIVTWSACTLTRARCLKAASALATCYRQRAFRAMLARSVHHAYLRSVLRGGVFDDPASDDTADLAVAD